MGSEPARTLAAEIPWVARRRSAVDEQANRPGRSRPPLSFVVALVFAASALTYLFSTPRRPGPQSVDVGFLQDMILHHDQAFEMAFVVLDRAPDPSIYASAKEILFSQKYEVGLMEAYLQRWGYSPAHGPQAMGWMGHPVPVAAMAGMVSAADMGALSDSTGPELDRLFVRLMIEHHQGAVEMGRVAAREAGDQDVRALAARIVRNQSAEIEELRGNLGALLR